MKKMIEKLREELSIWKVTSMTNLEKLQNGTKDEIEKLCISLAYRSGNYTYQEYQVKEWLKQEVKTNCDGKVIIG